MTATRAPRQIEWRRAWRALAELVKDAERTDQVFEIIDALEGRSGEKGWQAFLAEPSGRRLLAERPSLLAALTDRRALEALPGDSLGGAYARFMREGDLQADALVLAEEGRVEALHHELDPDQRYLGDRMRDAHDLWHVLTGYGRDEAGEAALLAFTWAQSGNRGIALIVLAAALIGPKTPTLLWERYLYRAYRRGRRAGNLAVARYEELLPVSLAEARRRLGIEPPEVAHPEGVVVGNREDLTAAA